MNNIPLYIYDVFIIHISVDGYLGCFQFLFIMNRATMDEQVSL